MALDFPNSPSANDIYTNAGTTWVYDGSKWNILEDKQPYDKNLSTVITTDSTLNGKFLQVFGGIPTWSSTISDATDTSIAQDIGYLGIPAAAGRGGTSPFTTNSADVGKYIYINISRAITISTIHPIGASIVFIAGPSGTISIGSGGSDTMYLAGDGSTGTRTLAAYGIATALKVDTTTWFISGNGLS
jgi:hypothetical protein